MEYPATFKLSKDEIKLFKWLRSANPVDGQVLRVAGGWVRDKILGKESEDLDIALDKSTGVPFANAFKEWLEDKVPEVFKDESEHSDPDSPRDSSPKKKIKLFTIKPNPHMSKHLECASMELPALNCCLDFVNLRVDEYAEGSRIPKVKFGTPSEDAHRRDFTINSLFYNLQTEMVEDFTGGFEDMKNKILRTPLSPLETFTDDPLRVFRAVRFLSTLDGFTPDFNLELAARDPAVHSRINTKVSRDRIVTEITKTLKSGYLRYCCRLGYWMQSWNLWPSSLSMESLSCSDEEISSLFLKSSQMVSLMSSIGNSVTSSFTHFTDSNSDPNFIPSRNGPLALLFSGALYKLTGQTVQIKKQKSPKTEHLLHMSKFPKEVSSLSSEIQEIGSALSALYSSKIEVVSRSQLGSILRRCKDSLTMEHAIVFASALSSDLDFEKSKEILRPEIEPSLSSAIVLANRMRSDVIAHQLWGVWGWQPLLNGYVLGDLLPKLPKGPKMKEVMDEVIDWMLISPTNTTDCVKCKEWIKNKHPEYL